MFIIERKFGNDGYAAWFKTLEIIGDSENHFIDCRNPECWEYLLARLNVDSEKAEGIFSCLAEVQAISKSLWDNRVIFSENFVKNIYDVYKRRLVNAPTKEFIVNILNLNIGVSVNKNKVNANRNPQNKVKQSKIKETIYPEWLDLKLFKEFKKMRTKLKKPLTEFAEERAIAKLKTLCEEGYDQETIVSLAIERDWLTFYPPKDNGADNGRNNSTGVYTPEDVEAQKKLNAWRKQKAKQETALPNGENA